MPPRRDQDGPKIRRMRELRGRRRENEYGQADKGSEDNKVSSKLTRCSPTEVFRWLRYVAARRGVGNVSVEIENWRVRNRRNRNQKPNAGGDIFEH